jgi:hypothetical protein
MCIIGLGYQIQICVFCILVYIHVLICVQYIPNIFEYIVENKGGSYKHRALESIWHSKLKVKWQVDIVLRTFLISYTWGILVVKVNALSSYQDQ